MKPKKLLTTLALVSVVLIAGCKKDTFVGTVGVCPLVVSTIPVNGATGVPLNQIITATFNENMNDATITPTSFTIETEAKGASLVAGTITYAGMTATFTPTVALTPNTTYTGRVASSVKDLMGYALQEDYVWTFTTGLTFTLNVTAVNGTVVNNPDQLTYYDASAVQLTASPDPGYSFTSWSGDATGSVNPLTVNMNANKNITANFTINTYTLNVTAVNGIVVKNPDQLTYDYGTLVQLNAVPDLGYDFVSWSGDIISNVNPLTVTMNADKDITANFTPEPVNTCPTIVDLGTSGNYVILSESGISTTGVTLVTGNMGINPAAATLITGFGLILPAGGAYSTSSSVVGKIYAPGYAAPTPANLVTATGDMHTAYSTANGLVVPAPTNEFMAGNLNGQTLSAGIYKWSSNVGVTNGIILDGGGDNCATFIFQIAGDLTVANSAIITLQNGAQAKNIFWVVAGSKAALGTDVDFSGNILCKTLISLNTRAKVKGRLLAQTAVTLDAATVVKP